MNYPTFDEMERMQRAKDPMRGRPLVRGDAQNVVLVLSMDIAALRFIAHSLPYGDEYTNELLGYLDEVIAAIRAHEEATKDQPGLKVLIEDGNIRLRVVRPT